MGRAGSVAGEGLGALEALKDLEASKVCAALQDLAGSRACPALACQARLGCRAHLGNQEVKGNLGNLEHPANQGNQGNQELRGALESLVNQARQAGGLPSLRSLPSRVHPRSPAVSRARCRTGRS